MFRRRRARADLVYFCTEPLCNNVAEYVVGTAGKFCPKCLAKRFPKYARTHDARAGVETRGGDAA